MNSDGWGGGGDGGVMGSIGKIGGLIRFNGILITVLGDHCSIIHSVEGGETESHEFACYGREENVIICGGRGGWIRSHMVVILMHKHC